MTADSASTTSELTGLLQAWSGGDQQALDKLAPRVHRELHRIAARYMAGEWPNHPLQTTALINEAYIRLINWKDVQWQNRAHFFAVSAQLMRRILVDFARSRNQAKHGRGIAETTLDEAIVLQPGKSPDLVLLDEALTRLAEMDPRKGRVIELRFFGGLTVQETAEVLQISDRTVLREWNLAKAWLYREIAEPPPVTPNEWHHIDRIFNEALEKEPNERAPFIEEACAGDASLRKEVDGLIAAHEQAGRFLESGPEKAVSSQAASIAAGTHLGPYEILAPIGAGGMGEVYKAHDARLRRDVAVKVLQRVVSDAAAWERFQREARASSALTHPNICMIHDVGDADGQPYLVMELLEGVTLSVHIAGKPLEADAAVAIAAQIAEAIEAAHAKGIIHRDIKPANVMITGSGRVKVLDFGLAKQTEIGEHANTEIREHVNATALDSVTMTGAVTGTPPYLSPEVLQGARADARSDLWAFGVLLYQMLAGRLPFTGATVFDISSAILNDPMPPLPASVPVRLRTIVERCLAKRPEERYQSAGEVRTALEPLQTRPNAGVGISRRAWLQAAGATAVALLAGSGALWRWRGKRVDNTPPLARRFENLTVFPGDEYSAAISSDGKVAIYLRDLGGQLDAWIQGFDAGAIPQNVTNGKHRLILDNRNFRGVGFAPKGEVWFLNNPTPDPVEIYRAPLLNGASASRLQEGCSPVWAQDGRTVFHLNGKGDPIFIADGDGKNPREVHRGVSPVHCHFPIWSLDSQFIYFVRGIIATEEMDIWRIKPDQTGLERITSQNTRITHPEWLNSRTLIYTAMAEDSSEQRLYSFDVESRIKQPLRDDDDDQYLSVAISSKTPRRLIATRARPTATLHTLAISDRSLQKWNDVLPFDALSSNTRVLSPRYARSPDPAGQDDLLFLSSKGGKDGLWKLENGNSKPLGAATDGGIVAPPAISRDGRRICFSFRKNGRSGLYVMDSKGGPWRSLVPDSLDIRGAASWDPDGTSVVVAASRGGKGTHIFTVPVPVDPSSGSTPVRLVDALSYHPLWSPDGTFILYSEPPPGAETTLKAVKPNREPMPLPDIVAPYGTPGIVYRFIPGIPGRGRIIALVVNKISQRQCFDLVDLDSGKTVRLAELEVGRKIRDFDISSDGKQIIFDRVQDNGDIVWMDLPEISA